MTLQAIADVLNAEGVPTLRGGAMWRPSSVQRAAGYRRPVGGVRRHRTSAPQRLNADTALRIYARGRMWNRGVP